MNKFKSNVISRIEATYENFTNTEKKIADFFISNKEIIDFSAKNISSKLYVSEASLSRFSKKMSFKGYREFIYQYKNTMKQDDINIDNLTKGVLETYGELLNKSYSLIDDKQMIKVAKLLLKYDKVYTYGIGSSGTVAQEFRIRFMRLGLHVEHIIDEHIMKMNRALIDEKTLVIGFSISGNNIIKESLKVAKEKGAKTIIITSSNDYKLYEFCDEVMLIAVKKNLEIGNTISPQFPMLVITDVLYAHFLNLDYKDKNEILTDTLEGIKFK
ncbi:MurR/RpiR family transcriptional regulator [Senegalia massiliensis]|uniref:MurR/RpiR family transcriptional regulator n=1 Tax=Senegalia massiliensis TaxID=1720316 RepID=A0A845R0W9_9CLOT|nr:MurR/RpiR family transcriptional regulator [Senegalia massiliensis]NBI07082.1 MurR/RpiR family transcriptional regulator [Senegalia massiliensis]